MKYLYKLILLISIGTVVVNCERDDICSEDTPTTPRLRIEFYDIAERESLKIVPRLSVIGDGLDPELAESYIVRNANTSDIQLPLIVGEEDEEQITRYELIRFETLTNGDPNPEANTDILEISYITKYDYVSRACGFKGVFTNLRVSIIDDDGERWVLDTSFPDTNTDNITVENEGTVHVNLFH